MLLAFAGLAGLTVAGLLVGYLAMPKERLGTIGFRLTFDGAEQDKYPNGTDFSTAEIIGTPVLSEVHRINDLGRYMPFEDFKQAMFVLQENLELDMLSSEYQAKLADTKLTPVDRARVEEEFRRRREALKSASYSLNFHWVGRVKSTPSELMGKVLQDTLSTWAQQAADRRGATLYNVPVVSRKAPDRALLTSQDHLIAVDVMQVHVERALKDLEELAKIPGAQTVSLGEGASQVSVRTLQTRFEDLDRFQLQPLLGALATSSGGAQRYLQERLAAIRLRREEQAERLKSLQDALRAYSQRNAAATVPAPEGEGRSGSVMPQLGESFLNRLLELSSESTDATYRQDLTARIIKEGAELAELNRKVGYYTSLSQAARPAAGGELSPALAAAKQRAFDDLSKAVNDLAALYDGISQYALNPSGVLYTITTPFMVHRVSALGLKMGLIYLVTVLFVGLIVIPAVAAGVAFVRTSNPPSGSSASEPHSSAPGASSHTGS